MEPRADISLNLGDITGRMTASAVNDSPTDATQNNPDCQAYGYVSEDGTVTQTPDAQWVGSGYWSYFQRGRPGSSVGAECPGLTDSSLRSTSALGFRTNDPGTVQGGQTFLVGTIRHNNFPIRSSYHWVHGAIDVQVAGKTESFPFVQEETDNTDVEGGVSDVLTITRTTATNIVLTEDGMPYRLVLWGFLPTEDGTCPEDPGDATAASDQFVTAEGQTTFACLYGSFNQERTLTLTKTATAGPGSQDVSIPAFSYTVSPGRSLVAEDAFDPITPAGLGESGTQASGAVSFYAGMSDFTVTEDDPAADQGGGNADGAAEGGSGWGLTELSCTNGVGQAVDVAYDLASRAVDFTGISAATSVEALPVTCAFTNHYTARSTLTLVKEVVGADEGDDPDPSLWTLTATGTDSTTTGTAVSGTSGSSEVTSRVLPSGTYRLSEDSPEGYQAYRREATQCVTEAGEQLETAQDSVTLPDGDDVTCTIINAPTPATLTWSKTDDAGDLLAGSEWVLNGPDGTRTTVADNSEPDEDSADGRFRLTGLAWGTYTLEEVRAPAGYLPTTETLTVTVDAATPEATADFGSVVNTAGTGSVTWSKVDAEAPATVLGGSEWVLSSQTGAEIPVTDCTETGCAAADTDAATGFFKVENLPFGTYTLRETKAPAGYRVASQSWQVVITAEDVDVSLGKIENLKAAGPTGAATGSPAVQPSGSPTVQPSGSPAVPTGPSAEPSAQVSADDLPADPSTQVPAGPSSSQPPGLPHLPLTGPRGAAGLLAVGAVLAVLGSALLGVRRRSGTRDLT